jgi:hypothetical protein
MRTFLVLSLFLSSCFGQVTLSPYSADKFPDLVAQIKPYMAGFEHDAMVMTNSTDKAIMATTVVWSYKSIQYGGEPHNVTRSFDNWTFPKQSFHAAIPAHSQALLAPSASGFERFKDAVDGKLQIEVDSIVFSDGEIDGPDLLAAGRDIDGRFEAAQLVANRVHLGRMSGKSIAQIAEELKLSEEFKHSMSPGVRLPGRMNWLHQYQSRLENMADKPEMITAFLNSLDNMVKPPVFHKAVSK